MRKGRRREEENYGGRRELGGWKEEEGEIKEVKLKAARASFCSPHRPSSSLLHSSSQVRPLRDPGTHVLVPTTLEKQKPGRGSTPRHREPRTMDNSKPTFFSGRKLKAFFVRS